VVATASFVVFLALFSAIGIRAARYSTGTSEDYLVAGRSVSPWLTALSAVATNNSGYMFIGLLGFAYRYGVQAVWLQFGWILGDVVMWMWAHRRIREVSGELSLSSVPSLVASRRDGSMAPALLAVSAVLTFCFLGGYAAAQFRAGSTALEQLFGWPSEIGAILGAVIVVAYCFSGGIRASIWTDAAHAVVMFVAMLMLTGAAAAEVGGLGALGDALAAADPELVRWVPEDLAFGFGIYVLGFHLSDYADRSIDRETWTGKRGRRSVTCSITAGASGSNISKTPATAATSTSAAPPASTGRSSLQPPGASGSAMKNA